MTLDQKKKITFLHHAVWLLARELGDEFNNDELIAHLEKFHGTITPFAEQKQELYYRYVDKGAVLFLNDVIL